MMTFDELNWIETGGVIGRTRRLPTMTIVQHTNGRFLVLDDAAGGRLISSGHATVDDAVKANQAEADRRVMPR